MSEQRNWTDLPWDALSLIFQKLNAVDILLSAENVCISWRQVAVHEPLVWRRINIGARIGMQKLACKAVDRSGGDVEEFYAEGSAVSDELLAYMAQRVTGRLRRLALLGSHFSGKALLDLARRCPMLQSLAMLGRSFLPETYGHPFSPETYGELGRACPELKNLTIGFSGLCGFSGGIDDLKFAIANNMNQPELKHLTIGFSRFCFQVGIDGLAFAIANNMTQLRELRLISSTITNVGLDVILDKCLNLEILDLRGSCQVCVDDGLQEKLSKIKYVMLPDR